IRLHTGISTAFQISAERSTNKEYLVRKFSTYLIDAAIEHTFPIDEKRKVFVELGYLPVRYNPQAANLGEYLFGRSTPYPATIESGFELADKEKITGIHAVYHHSFLNKSWFKVEPFFFSEMKQWPIGDFSVALLLTTNLENIVEVGGGVNFHHLISVDEKETFPVKEDSARLRAQSYKYIYIDENNDTVVYGARGIKAMGRLTLNPRALIPWTGLGSEDLKLYTEFAILGVENYAGWYENRWERIPIMFGFNFPAFKVLDVCAIQLQWFGNKYYNTWELMKKDGVVIPYVGRRATGTDIPTPEGFRRDTSLWVTEDDWKWSIYMSKKLWNRIRLSLQFACDNMFKTAYMPPAPYVNTRHTEIFRNTWVTEIIPILDEDGEIIGYKRGESKFGRVDNWYWMARIMFYF
ncbi:MAG: hypothetical protein N2053_11680, partial [Chitinispirillaceae bacterium]|nr:hypothetical protein [Chitinispirillaceae bacterium]